MWGKCVGSGLGEGLEEVVVLRGNDIAEILDVVRWVRERERELGEGGGHWVVGSCRLDRGIGGEVTEDVSKGYSEGFGSGTGGGVSERCGAHHCDVWGVEDGGFWAFGLWEVCVRSRGGMPSGGWGAGLGLGLGLGLGRVVVERDERESGQHGRGG
jgi:hypothetical protein